MPLWFIVIIYLKFFALLSVLLQETVMHDPSSTQVNIAFIFTINIGAFAVFSWPFSSGKKKIMLFLVSIRLLVYLDYNYN